MKKNNGISLIVLVITIIVIIILATAILVSVISNNPISEANKARYESDRDNMQAVFTNTVAKIAAENQGVVNVTAGQINQETSGTSKTTGQVYYTVTDAINEANASGTIIFDKGENTDTVYYIGRQLPIYAAGETIWYVDSEGIMSLEVGEDTYGMGKINEPGLYDANNVMVASWDELVNIYGLNIQKDYAYSSNKSGTMRYILENNDKLASGTKVIIPDSVTKIGDWSFESCKNLTSVIIPNSVTFIGWTAFQNCSSLVSITIPSSVTTMESTIFNNCSGLQSVTILGNIKSIGEFTFGSCTNLTEINLPDSITSFGQYAFSGCTSLTNITLPTNLGSLGRSMFQNCTGLTSIVIPNKVYRISAYAFSGCSSLTTITIPNSVTNIGLNITTGCTSLSSITVDQNNTKYDSRNNCNAIIEKSTNTLIASCQNTTIPNSVTNIGERSFYDVNITSITIPDSVTSIDDYAFIYNKSIISINGGNGLTNIGAEAFGGCTNLNSINIPNSVTNIGNYAFSGCKSLPSINIPDGITNIGKGTFKNCTNLKSIYIPSSVETIITDTSKYYYNPFYNCSPTLKIYCGVESKPDGWGEYWNYYDNKTNQLEVQWGVTRDEYNSIIAE